MRNVSHKSCRENQNTHFTFSKFRAIYEIIWKSMVEPGRPQTTIIWRMRTACWTTKATDTLIICKNFLLFNGSNGYATQPLCYVYAYISARVLHISSTEFHRFVPSALQVSSTCTLSLKLVHSLLQWPTSDFMYSPSDITTQCRFTTVTTTATVMGCLGGCRLPWR